MRFFFTTANNQPSGGTKVLNQVVSALNDEGFEAWLCPPASDSLPAKFMSRPAPTLPLESVAGHVLGSDVVVFGWNSQAELELARTARVRKKILWQHGTLISRLSGSVGEEMHRDPGMFDEYWNVSSACGDYVVQKYGFAGYRLVQPFFDPDEVLDDPLENRERRKGVLFQALRGSVHIDRFADLCRENGFEVTILRRPFSQVDLAAALRQHKFFVSLDRGLSPRRSVSYRRARLRQSWRSLSELREAIVPAPVWVAHSQNYVGFPMTPAQAARMGCAVVSSPMGGGLEWMSESTCFMARDGDLRHLEFMVREALATDESDLERKVLAAHAATARFSKEATISQILEAAFHG